MKINVEMINKTNEEQVLIQCYEITQQIDEIINFVKSTETILTAYKFFSLFKIDNSQSHENRIHENCT